jgi:hypothetical protein
VYLVIKGSSEYFFAGANGFCGWFVAKLKTKALQLRPKEVALIFVSATPGHQTERCETEKWQFLFFCLTSFRLVAEMMITVKGCSTCLIENVIVYFQ